MKHNNHSFPNKKKNKEFNSHKSNKSSHRPHSEEHANKHEGRGLKQRSFHPRAGKEKPSFQAERDQRSKPSFGVEQALEQRFGKAQIQKWVAESRIAIANMLKNNESGSASSENQNSTVPESTAGLRGFALAQHRQRVLLNQEKNQEPASLPKTYQTPGGLLLDEWQHKAVQSLLAGHHVVIDAPTSAGKTRVIEALLEYRMDDGDKLIYTSPVKSLSNDKYREFCEKYGRDKVGINTGDFKENLSAPIILATLETYRNSLLGIEPSMSRKTVVYDEYHFLQDESRGSAWEESLILTPQGSQLVLLSASVPNCDDFASWIQGLTGTPADVIRVSKRPVPLVHVIASQEGLLLADLIPFKEEDAGLFLKLNQAARRQKPRFKNKDSFKDLVLPVIDALAQNMGPIVVYAGRRGDVEAIANVFARHLKSIQHEALRPRSPYEKPLHVKDDLLEKVAVRTASLQGWEYVPSELQKLILKYGVAYHHSGMIPPCRVAIETLLKEGLLHICCGTMGISLGVNFAVRTAFVSDESRPGEGGEVKYSNTEIMQMLGRAGRRGHDKQGFSLWLDMGRYFEFRPKEREACQSSLKFDPTTVISLLGHHQSLDYLSEFYRKSFYMRGKMTANNRKSLNKIVLHLQKINALDGAIPTHFGDLARHFPQSGGLLVAHWLAKGQFQASNISDYLQAMACFGSAHFKEIPETYADMEFLNSLNMPALIDKFYPSQLFPELYDEVKGRKWEEESGKLVFREFNYGAASIVKQWLNPKTTWEDLVADHSSKTFSDGDCMNVLFRFATFLQSCARLEKLDRQLALEAKKLWKVLLREPLDARNRMLLEEDNSVLENPIEQENMKV